MMRCAKLCFSCLAATLPYLIIAAGIVEAQHSADVAKLLEAARFQIGRTVHYDGRYQRIGYPGGDLPFERGVCTDVVIRAYRALGIDLQKLVHEDMQQRFASYPSKRLWRLHRPDANIDHRRVPNLQTFLRTHGRSFSTDLKRHPPKPGDLLTWMLPGNLPHIGIVSDRTTLFGTPLVIHNIGAGTQEEDVIGRRYELTGHYRYAPWEQGAFSAR